MPKERDVDGNAMASELAFQRQMLRMAEQYLRFEQVGSRLWSEDVELRNITVRMPKAAGGEYLVVVRADVNDSACVAFESADTFAEVVRRVLAKLENGTVKWKDDQYG